MNKDHFVVQSIDNKKCIIKNKSELTKNNRDGTSDRCEGGIIVETDSEKCPIKVFSLYLSKLCPKSNFLWQLIFKKQSNDDRWYHRKAGKDTIAQFMPKISEICGLSRRYTNHCLRATKCTFLGRNFSDLYAKS